MAQAVAVTTLRWNFRLEPERKRRRVCAWNCCISMKGQLQERLIKVSGNLNFYFREGIWINLKTAPGMRPCFILKGPSTDMSVTLPVKREEEILLTNCTFWLQRPQNNESTNSIHISINYCCNISHYRLWNYTSGASPFCRCQ